MYIDTKDNDASGRIVLNAESADKLTVSAGSTTQPVYFKNGVPTKISYTIKKSVPSNAVFTDTHNVSSNVVTNSSTSTTNTTAALTNNNVYLNHIDGGALTSTHKIVGTGATTVTTDASGNISINSNNTTYSAADDDLGLVKSGGDVTIENGIINVNDNSHGHIVDNIEGLQDILDSKAEAKEGVYYIEGTGSTTGTWLGSHSGITEYYNGLMLAYKIPIAGNSSGTTLNINNLGAITVRKNNNTAISTTFPVNSVIFLVYTTDSGTAYWKAHDYDANTRYTVGDYQQNGVKLYLVGSKTTDTATSTSYANSYTNANVYIGTDNKLYATQGFAGTADRATGDGTGNNIINTYETKTDASTKLADARAYAGTVSDQVKTDLLGGASTTHNTLKKLEDLISANDQAIDVLDTEKVDNTIEISAGAGLTGGGNLTTNRTISANLISTTKLTNAATAATETSGRVYPVAVDKNGKLAVNVPWTDNNTTYSVATSSKAGLVKSGGDITVATDGTVSVNDNSHGHVIGNIEGLQTALNNKSNTGHTHLLSDVKPSNTDWPDQTLTGDNLEELLMDADAKIVALESSKAPINHASDDKTYGGASGVNYGHVKLSSAVNGTETITDSVAATPLAVKTVNDKAVTGVTLSDKTLTVTKGDGTSTTYTTKDTTYSVATSSKNGLMSAADKAKLDTVTANAQPNQNAFSEIIIGDTTIAADAESDSLTLVAGSNITLTPDATNDKITITAKDTTYSNFVKSGPGAKSGLVPAPSTTAGTSKYLREDGTWVTPPNTNTTYTLSGVLTDNNTYTVTQTPSSGNATTAIIPAMSAASASAAGKAGLVPAAAKGNQAKFLRGDGTWQTPTDTTYGLATESTDGLMSAEDYARLKNVQAGANNYTLPNAGSDLGGVKTGGVATISNGQITAISQAGKVTNALTFGEKTYDGSAAKEITAADLGLASAMKFLGSTTTTISDGATVGAITLSDGSSITPTAGNVVLYGNAEFVVNASNKWELLGNEGSYKVVQGAVSSPSASGTALAFIDTITQNANGQITATKKTVADATTSAHGLMTSAMVTKLNGITESADSVSFSRSLTSGTKVGTITINGTGTDLFAPTNTDQKVTSVGNHYAPAADTSAALSVDASSTTAATWDSTSLVTGVNLQRDAKGHVTSLTVDSIKMPANPNTNTTYDLSGALDSGNSTYTVTLTPSSGTADTAIIPVMSAASADAAGTAGLVPTPAAGKQAKFLRGDGTWQTPTNTNTLIRVYRQTSGYDGNYPLLVSRTAAGSIGTAGSNGTYSGVYGVFREGTNNLPTLLANPAKGTITATGGFKGTADAAISDGMGQEIVDTYATKSEAISSITGDGSSTTINYTKADGTTGSFTTKDTDTHYTTKMYATTSSGTANAAATNGNTYLRLFDNSTVRSSIKIQGGGSTTVTSDANGVITVNSVDNNTTYTAGTGLTLSSSNQFSITKANASTILGLLGAGDTAMEEGTYVITGNATDPTSATFYKRPVELVVNSTLVKAALGTGTGTTKYLREDGTWDTPIDTQYGVATSSTLGLIKSGTDITVDSNGNVSVNNDSHTHDGRYFTETEVTNKLATKMDLNPAFIELFGSSGGTNGGYIDFHYAGDSGDFTSRIIESASGTLSINNSTFTTSLVSVPRLKITSTSGVRHIEFSRTTSYNYLGLSSDDSGASIGICINTSLSKNNCQFIVNRTSLTPGKTGTIDFGTSDLGWKNIYLTSQIHRVGISSSWYNGRDNAMIRQTSYTGYNPILSAKTTNGSWELGPYVNDTLYFIYNTDTGYGTGTNTDGQYFNSVRLKPNGTIYGAVWNDYAEYRICNNEFKAGQVVCENNDDTVSITTQRMQPGACIVSDTFGFAIGETDKAQCPVAVSGRVLAYTYEPREEFQAGDAVCAGPNGTISRMTREEIKEYPERMIGTVSAVPNYETWGQNNVNVDGRIWIKVV